jgi:hypothetical protein
VRLLVAYRLEKAAERGTAEPVATDLQSTATQCHDDAPSPVAR